MAENWQGQQLVSFYNTNFEFTVEQMKTYIAPLMLKSEDNVIDFGCGNGALLNHIAPQINYAVGVDISDKQLEAAAKLLSQHQNIELLQGDYLNLDLGSRIFTKGSARKTLHHLTDDEKFDFFATVGKHFTKDSLLIIEDAIYDFSLEQFHANKTRIVEQAQTYYGVNWKNIKGNFYGTLMEEYPTDYQTLQNALEYGGFKIVFKEFKTCFFATIVARRVI